MIYIVLLTILVLAVCYTIRRRNRRLTWLPGPPGIPLLGNMLQVHSNGLRLNMLPWKQRYGDVFRIQLLQQEYVVAAGYDVMHEILVSKGPAFSDRPDDFLNRYLRLNTGITYVGPSKAWYKMRKLSHKYFRQYGAGMDRLEHIVFDISKDMLDEFHRQSEQPFDPHRIVRITTLRMMAYLVTGMKVEAADALLNMVDEIEKECCEMFASQSVFHMFVSFIPFLVHLPLSGTNNLHRIMEMRQRSWNRIKKNQKPESDSLVRLFLDHTRTVMANEDIKNDFSITENDAHVASIELMEAGTTTTTATFTFLLHIVASRADIQQHILDEINGITGSNPDQRIQLKHRDQMPFTRAVIFETLRMFPPTPNSITHRAMEDTVIQGDVLIPKGTQLIMSIWAIHHNEEFWGDPETVRPERFLDEHGAMLPADHPNRKHLMTFGAGTRVCVAEQFALARLFLLIAAVVQRFKMELSEDTRPNWLDSTTHREDLILRPLPYNVICTPRNNY